MTTKEEILRLKDRIDCRDLIKSYGINLSGQNISCLNPSHPDNNPSMAVYKEHALCFGCGHNLDAIGIVQNLQGLSFQEAVDYLASKYNISISNKKENSYNVYKKIGPTFNKKFDFINKNSLHSNTYDSSIKNMVWEIIQSLEPTKEAIEWLSKRKISVKAAWELGCRDLTPAIKEITDLIEHSNHELLKANNFINEAGGLWTPILNKIKGNNDYSGLLIPIFDLKSNVHSFRWRFFNPIKKTIKSKEIILKVLGQPSCPLMPVGLNYAQRLSDKDELYICEGEPDWLSLNSIFQEQNLKGKFAIGFCAFSLNWDNEWTKIISEFKKINICLHNTDKAKKIADSIQEYLIQNSSDKKEYWKKNIFEHYFEESNDINDHLKQNKLILNEITFNTKKYKEESKLSSINIPPMNILDVCINPPPKLEFVFPGLLRGIVGSVVSAGGTGKTMWAIQTCASIACGIDTLGFGEINQGKTVFLSGEDPEKITAIRLNTLGKILNQKQLEDLNKNLKIYSISGQNPDIFNADWFNWIKEVSQDSKLVIIDTLRVFHNSEENDSGKMSELIKLLGTIAKDNNTSILFLHHTNKNSANNSSGSDQQASRGSSVLTDNIKLQINLVTMTQLDSKDYGIEENDRKLYVKYVYSKMNYGAPIPDRWLKRELGGILNPVELKKNDLISQVFGSKKNVGF